MEMARQIFEMREKETKKSKKIAIVLNEPYPMGMAASNRTHLYAKGLLELGNEVRILLPRFLKESGKIMNNEFDGIHEGVYFRYACNPARRSRLLSRKIQTVLSILNSFAFFINYNPGVVIVVSNNSRDIILTKICSIIIHSKIIREVCEVPFHWLSEISRNRKRRVKAEFGLFHGLILISDTLEDFFIKELSLNVKILKVPILLSLEERNLKKENTHTIVPNLVYTGSLSNHKDGILLIIKAFSRITENYPQVRLIMTGDISYSPDKENILKYIEDYKINTKVDLTGYISKEELNRLTSTAAALISAKPYNRQNHYNMATKVGEYLITGRPVIISSVDPVCNHLEHRVDAFIVNPDADEIAEEFRFILDHPEKAQEIGLMGQKKALKLFDYKTHTSRINDFFRTI
jgi:glycosyltransferase involved in cell wall biosynthesis